ncbi:MAG TPA: phosphopantetheine-binding protein [Mycobacterium sp.]
MQTGQREVFGVVRRQILDVLPHLDPTQIRREANMSDLGANSIDRMDVVIGAMLELDIQIPAHRLAGIQDIGSLVATLSAEVAEQEGR